MIKNFLLIFCLFLISCDSKESDPLIEGCIDFSACNFNSFAEIDDGSCIAPNECDLCNECDVDVGSIYLTEDQKLLIEEEREKRETIADRRRKDFQLAHALDLIKGLSVTIINE